MSQTGKAEMTAKDAQQWLANYWMEHGCLKNADAEHCAKEILDALNYDALLDRLAKYEQMWTDMHYTICRLEQDLRKASSKDEK